MNTKQMDFRRIKINKKRFVKRFLDYVKIDSISKNETNFAKRLIKDLKALKIKCKQDKIGNIICRIKGKVRKAPRLMLNAHIDTVEHSEKIIPQIVKGVIKTKRNTILGADNKAGVAAIMEALTILAEKHLLHGDLLIVFTVQEEIGLFGAKSLNPKSLKADFGLTFDGGRVEEIIIKAPSQYNINVEVFGKAAHAGVHPEDGINAIQVASKAIAKIKLGRIDPETTANIGIIEGGIATNIVPEKVILKGEVRSHNKRKLKTQIKKIENRLTRTCSKHKARLKLRTELVYESFKVKEKEKMIVQARKVLKNMGLKPRTKQTGGGSDANIFNSFGIKTIILGVGAQKVHTPQERVAISDLELGTKLILGIINEICQKS